MSYNRSLIISQLEVPPSYLYLLPEVDSTNTFLSQCRHNIHQAICLAESQAQGRGRQGKKWESPPGANIYCSIGWRLSDEPLEWAGLSLVVGIAVAKWMSELGLSQVGLKWPNDIYVADAKCAGILVELNSQTNTAIIGVGVNVQASEQLCRQVDQNVTALSEHVELTIDRDALVATMLNHLFKQLERFNHLGFAVFLEDWARYDIFSGKAVEILENGVSSTGLVTGVSQTGALMLDIGGRLKMVNSATVSIRLL